MFTGFSLALPRTGQHRVEDLLRQSFGDEPLDDDCICGAPRGSRTKHTELLRGKSPEVLVLQLKRWIWTWPRPDKNSIHVSYETLLPLSSDAVYDLRSVIIHDGPPGSGHYTCYVRGWDNFWYLCNDRQAPVRQARVDVVLNRRPYMLVYEKRLPGLGTPSHQAPLASLTGSVQEHRVYTSKTPSAAPSGKSL